MRPEILYPLFADISNLRGVGAKTQKLLTTLIGGNKIVDLAFHLPINLIDRRYCPTIRDAVPGQLCTLKVKVVEHQPPKTRQQPYKVAVEDDTGELTLLFFKVYADSIAKNLPIGATRLISGKTELFNGRLQMSHPDYILPESDKDKLPWLEQVYPLTAGLTNKMVSRYVSEALDRVPALPEWSDDAFIKETAGQILRRRF